ncbi:hypothetical protein D3C81_1875670 [compost metagenome]
MGLAPFGADLVDQRRELVRAAPGHAGDIALARKASGNGTACGVSGTYYQDGFLVGHRVSSVVCVAL